MPSKIVLKKDEKLNFSKSAFGGKSTLEPVLRQCLDGQPYRLDKGVDYSAKTEYMPYRIVVCGLKMGYHFDITRKDAQGQTIKDGLIVQARPLTDDEKLRAKERLDQLKAGSKVYLAKRKVEEAEEAVREAKTPADKTKANEGLKTAKKALADAKAAREALGNGDDGDEDEDE